MYSTRITAQRKKLGDALAVGWNAEASQLREGDKERERECALRVVVGPWMESFLPGNRSYPGAMHVYTVSSSSSSDALWW